mmetsp:Transcript_92105/g.298186  ORF Transcript_92105/g.298186 Transcript_92105/m.298186 type:complete len:204 (-) Transcript_92105:776-1387(-)
MPNSCPAFVLCGVAWNSSTMFILASNPRFRTGSRTASSKSKFMLNMVWATKAFTCCTAVSAASAMSNCCLDSFNFLLPTPIWSLSRNSAACRSLKASLATVTFLLVPVKSPIASLVDSDFASRSSSMSSTTSSASAKASRASWTLPNSTLTLTFIASVCNRKSPNSTFASLHLFSSSSVLCNFKSTSCNLSSSSTDAGPTRAP